MRNFFRAQYWFCFTISLTHSKEVPHFIESKCLQEKKKESTAETLKVSQGLKKHSNLDLNFSYHLRKCRGRKIWDNAKLYSLECGMACRAPSGG